MSDWKVVKARDDDGNFCIYLQDGADSKNRELYEFVEPDIKANFPGQYEEYVQAAQAEADERNA